MVLMNMYQFSILICVKVSLIYPLQQGKRVNYNNVVEHFYMKSAY